MATAEECAEALHDLAARLRSVDEELRQQHAVDRTLTLWVSDLKEVFRGRLGADGLTDIARGGQHDGQVRLKLTSNDLIALTKGELGFATAWATGRLKMDASISDLLRLRALL